MTNWPLVTLASLCRNAKADIVDGPFGSNLKREDYITSGIPVLKIQNIKESGVILKKMDYVTPEKFTELSRHSFRRGDIVITKLGDPLGVAAVVDEIDEGLIVADLVRIRVDESRVDTRYLAYAINSTVVRTWLNDQQKGSTRPRVSLLLVRAMPIPLPPLDEQKRIVAKLDEIASIFQQRVRILSEKRDDARALHRKLLDDVFSAREGIPRKLGDVVNLINGRAYAKDELLAQGTYRVLRVGNFVGTKAWYWSDLELPDDKYCQEGDLLYAWSASFGPQFWRGEKAIFHYHIWKVKPEFGEINPSWLYWWFLWDVEQVKKAEGTGATMMHVTKGAMERRELVIPSLKIQTREAAYLSECRLLLDQLDQILDAQDMQSQRFWEASRQAILAGAA